MGNQGDHGEAGVNQSPRGIRGDKGERGNRGIVGETGRTGATGAPGKTGASGERGAPGLSGSQESHRRFSQTDRRIAILFIIAMVTVVFIGWGEDRRSCERQLIPRRVSNIRAAVIYDYLTSAAQGRWNSYLNERYTDPKQAGIDYSLAVRWTKDAKRLEQVPIPNCNGVVAGK